MSARRTRGGCVNCKKRKRKCDEQRPECMACIQRNIQCGGYTQPVRWVEGLASRGRFVGVRDPGVLLQTTVVPANKVLDDVEVNYTQKSRVSSSENLDPSTVPTHQVVAHQHPISEEEGVAFEKFLVEGLHELCNTEVYSWLSVYFKAAAQESSALPIVGASLQEFYDNDKVWTVTAMERLGRAIRTFRAELELLGDERRSATIVSGLLICTTCLYQNRPITPYIRLLSDIHDLKGDLTRLRPDPRENIPSQHVLEVLGIMDMPSFLIGRIHPSRGIWKRVRALRTQSTYEVLGEIEAITGMPRSLLDAFAEISDSEDGDSDPETLFWNWPGCAGTLDQCHLWDSWRYGGILESRRRRKQRQPLQVASQEHDGSTTSGKHTSTEVVLCHLVASLDALIRRKEASGELQPPFLAKGFMFPFTLANLEVPILKTRPEWKSTLGNFRSVFFYKGGYKNGVPLVDTTLLELLDQAWEDSTGSYDIDQVARERGIEIGRF